MANEERTNQEMSKGIQKGAKAVANAPKNIKKTRQAVKNAKEKAKKAVKNAKEAGKAVGKAAGKAASGNFAGAAMELLKNETTRRVIVIGLLFTLLLHVGLFLAVPLAIYEALVAGVEAIAERWDEIYYSGDSGRFWSMMKATAGTLFGTPEEWKEVFSSIFDTSAGTEDMAELEDMQVLQNKAQTKKIYERKINAVISKMDLRMEAIQKLISSNRTNKNLINDIMKENFEIAFGYINQDDDREVKYRYDGYEIRFKKSSLTKRQAIQLVNLYSYQTNTSLDNIKISGLLRWLGYKDETREQHKIYFYLGNDESVCYTMNAWTGTFIPQYLIDEAGDENYQYYIERYGCSVADYLIYVDCPNLWDIQGSPQPTETQIDETIYYDIDDYVAYYPINDPDLSRVGFNPTTGECISCPMDETFPYYRVTVDKHPTLDYDIGSKDSGTIEFGILKRKPEYPYPANVKLAEHVYHIPTVTTFTEKIQVIPVKYYIDISISIRPLDKLLDMVGMWRGYLPWEDPEALLAKP